MTILTIPPDLLVSGGKAASEVLALPGRLHGVYDGTVPFGGFAGLDVPGCTFIFGMGWHQDFAGRGFEDMCEAAAVLGARLAGEKPGWPSGEAHVRSLPVTGFTFEFAVTPERLPVVEHKAAGVVDAWEDIAHSLPEDAAHVREQILAMAEQARQCSCGECSCGEQP